MKEFNMVILIGFIIGVGVIIFGVNKAINERHERALEINQGAYNSTTGDFYYENKDFKYIY